MSDAEYAKTIARASDPETYPAGSAIPPTSAFKPAAGSCAPTPTRTGRARTGSYPARRAGPGPSRTPRRRPGSEPGRTRGAGGKGTTLLFHRSRRSHGDLGRAPGSGAPALCTWLTDARFCTVREYGLPRFRRPDCAVRHSIARRLPATTSRQHHRADCIEGRRHPQSEKARRTRADLRLGTGRGSFRHSDVYRTERSL